MKNLQLVIEKLLDTSKETTDALDELVALNKYKKLFGMEKLSINKTNNQYNLTIEFEGINKKQRIIDCKKLKIGQIRLTSQQIVYLNKYVLANGELIFEKGTSCKIQNADLNHCSLESMKNCQIATSHLIECSLENAEYIELRENIIIKNCKLNAQYIYFYINSSNSFENIQTHSPITLNIFSDTLKEEITTALNKKIILADELKPIFQKCNFSFVNDQYPNDISFKVDVFKKEIHLTRNINQHAYKVNKE